jgi:hypothetical protein
MDSRRNHIIMVNLWLSMLNISVMATTVLPAFFGMNLDNGLAGDDPRFFMLVSCGTQQQLGLRLSLSVTEQQARLSYKRAARPEKVVAVSSAYACCHQTALPVSLVLSAALL